MLHLTLSSRLLYNIVFPFFFLVYSKYCAHLIKCGWSISWSLKYNIILIKLQLWTDRIQRLKLETKAYNMCRICADFTNLLALRSIYLVHIRLIEIVSEVYRVHHDWVNAKKIIIMYGLRRLVSRNNNVYVLVLPPLGVCRSGSKEQVRSTWNNNFNLSI